MTERANGCVVRQAQARRVRKGRGSKGVGQSH